jgi:methylmalonyl-CoA/ethylmalonyl-CoA epimerase
MPVSLPALLHVGIVVADMAAASAEFERRWNAPTVDVMDLTAEDATYQGETVTFTARYGFIRTGGSEVELIQPIDGPSPYVDFLKDHGDGPHHLAYVVEDTDAYLAQLGNPTLLLDAPLAPDGRFVYVEGQAPGLAIELIQIGPQMAAMQQG